MLEKEELEVDLTKLRKDMLHAIELDVEQEEQVEQEQQEQSKEQVLRLVLQEERSQAGQGEAKVQEQERADSHVVSSVDRAGEEGEDVEESEDGNEVEGGLPEERATPRVMPGGEQRAQGGAGRGMGEARGRSSSLFPLQGLEAVLAFLPSSSGSTRREELPSYSAAEPSAPGGSGPDSPLQPAMEESAECYQETGCTASCGDGFRLLLPNIQAAGCESAVLQVGGMAGDCKALVVRDHFLPMLLLMSAKQTAHEMQA
jgi:hypothetical protein